MLPLNLTLEGLYSYQIKQEINFTELTEAGLFGIFGAVGSGKSTILEAISFVLYGDTERLSKTDSRAYNMLNLKSKSAFISFDFLNFENKKFRFEARWSRKKAFDSVTPIERLAYAWVDDQWIPMESANAAQVIGLSYENFRRTIIIPQGKFKEFLDLKGKDRSEMMKEIFNLEAFDLQYNVAGLQADNNKKLEQLRGALTGFEDISEAQISLLQEKVQLFSEELESAQIQKTKLSEEVQKLLFLKDTLAEIEKNKSAKDSLLQQAAHIQQTEQALGKYEVALQHFSDLMVQAKGLEQESIILSTQIEQTEEAYRLQQERYHTEEAKLQLLQPEYTKLPTKQEEVYELGLAAETSALQHKNTALLERIAKSKFHIDGKKEEAQQLELQLKALESSREKLQQNRIDTSVLLAISNWYQQQDTVQRHLQDTDAKLLRAQEQLHLLEKSFDQDQLSMSSWQETLMQQEREIQAKQTEVNQQILTLQIATEISQFAHNLKEGEPCQLCGSLSHPSPQHAADLSADLSKAKLSQESLKVQAGNLQQLRIKYTTVEAQIQQKKNEVDSLRKDVSQFQEQVELALKAFIWADYNPSDRQQFELAKANSAAVEKELSLQDSQIKERRTTLQEVQHKLQEFELVVAKFKSTVDANALNILRNQKNIKQLDWDKLKHLSQDELIEQQNELKQKNQLLERQYNDISKLIQELKIEIVRQETLLHSLNQRKSVVSASRNEIESTLLSRLSLHQFEHLSEVEVLLSKPMDIAAEKQKIKNYYIQLEGLNQVIESLTIKIQGQIFEEHNYLHQSEQLQQLTDEINLQIGNLSSLKTELQRTIKEYEKKKDLAAQLDKLQTRASQLSTLSNLFRGAGFVNYVSTIYLQNLCQAANLRFHRLTKNQLSLAINAKSNEFEVIDYLNNGYPRSIKTLSGGQGFQASLCLELSLAESIQALNKADKNFFFIDEGFGTQDIESINTVFETLQYLNRESRVVGIISHVEELKERIPRSITIQKDEEKGSLITFNS